MLSNTTSSFLGNAATKVGKMAHSITHMSLMKIRITLTGSKKQVLEVYLVGQRHMILWGRR